MARTYPEYMAKAQALLGSGFHTKQAQKDAAEYVTRAYDLVAEEVRRALVGNDWNDMTEESRKLYDSMTACAHYSATKGNPYRARFPREMELLDACAVLRATIKVEPVTKAPPRPKSAKELKKEAESKTCQICGRPIFAEVGLIAHHGYTRPGDGWQTASCWGARELPYENSRDVLGLYVKALGQGIIGLEIGRGDMCAEVGTIRVAWEGEQITKGEEGFQPGRFTRHKHEVTFTRATFDAVTHATPEAVKYFHDSYDSRYYTNAAGMNRGSFDFWKFRDLVDFDRRIEGQWHELNRQRARFIAWKRTHEYNAARETWESVPC